VVRRGSRKGLHPRPGDAPKLTEAVAAHVLDGEPPPPFLVQAFDYKAWNGDTGGLPLGMFPPMRSAFNAYQALSGYMSASPNRGDWIARNPAGWDFVANVIADRKGVPR